LDTIFSHQFPERATVFLGRPCCCCYRLPRIWTRLRTIRRRRHGQGHNTCRFLPERVLRSVFIYGTT